MRGPPRSHSRWDLELRVDPRVRHRRELARVLQLEQRRAPHEPDHLGVEEELAQRARAMADCKQLASHKGRALYRGFLLRGCGRQARVL